MITIITRHHNEAQRFGTLVTQRYEAHTLGEAIAYADDEWGRWRSPNRAQTFAEWREARQADTLSIIPVTPDTVRAYISDVADIPLHHVTLTTD